LRFPIEKTVLQSALTGNTVGTPMLKAATKFFLRRYKKPNDENIMRAVFLGDSVSTRVILDGAFELYELDALNRCVFSQLPQDSTCLDIGANIGNHAVHFAKHFEKVIAFEPNPIVAAVLDANAFGRNIQTVHKGLSSSKGELPFIAQFPNLGLSRVTDDPNKADFVIQVEPLDKLVKELGIQPVSFVKIDVEGHELEVFRGGIDFFTHYKPVLAIEAMHKSNPEAGVQVCNFLREAGYKHFYEFVPPAAIVRKLEDTPFSLSKRFYRYLLPKTWRKSLSISEIETLENRDNPMAIASATPLSTAI
jgi:FkbM family methyltransferase